MGWFYGTLDAGAHQQKRIHKTCTSACSESQNTFECCNQDNCNHNEASGMGPPAIVLGAAVLISVTKALLWAGLLMRSLLKLLDPSWSSSTCSHFAHLPL